MVSKNYFILVGLEFCEIMSFIGAGAIWVDNSFLFLLMILFGIYIDMVKTSLTTKFIKEKHG